MPVVTTHQAPELVPARMLNEFVYCRRLFYLEWVDGLWEENSDTAQGTLVHERSDRGGGRLPPAEDLPDDWERSARSVTLDAPLLGVVAKIDVVEGEAGKVFVVDHKKGRPRDDGQPWEPERIQVAAQVLVLRENGYDCDRGYLSFRETRQRVEIVVDDELEARVRETLRDLRATAAEPTAPPPLVASPKCPRCSLVSICLPDEVAALHSTRARRAVTRRLVTPRPESAPLYVLEPGSMVRLNGGRIEVWKDKEKLASAREIDVLEVGLFGGVAISEPALRHLAAAGVPVSHFTFGGRLQALTLGLDSNNVQLRIEQFRTADDDERSLALARGFVAGKIRNQRVLIRRNSEGNDEVIRDLRRLSAVAEKARSASMLLGIEGAAARAYYRALPSLFKRTRSGLNREFDFERRSRRPPRDRVNAVLSFLYSVLVKECVVATRKVGFDPMLGFYHRPRFGRPALALDLMEELCPLVADSVLLTLVNGSRLGAADFVEQGGAVGLTRPGRRTVLAVIEQRLSTELIHPVFGYKVTYRRAIELQARMLASVLLGEIEAYRPLVTR